MKEACTATTLLYRFLGKLKAVVFKANGADVLYDFSIVVIDFWNEKFLNVPQVSPMPSLLNRNGFN